MARIEWGKTAFYNTGLSHGVLYPLLGPGVAWNGLISVDEKDVTANESFGFIDGQKYYVSKESDSYAATIEAFTYPDELLEYMGIDGPLTNQEVIPFGLSYRTKNEIHLIYNALINPNSNNWETLGADVELANFSWDISTLPEGFDGFRPSAHIVINLDYVNPGALQMFDVILYGADGVDSYLPTTQDLLQILEVNATIKIVDNGDGTWTATGPDELVHMLTADKFEIISPTATYITDEMYKIKSA